MDTITIIIICVLIVIVIIILVIVSYRKTKPKYKLMRFGGLFRNVSNLNLGHPKNAPIFNARPWFGTDFNSGLANYLGVITIPTDKSMYIRFPKVASNYEVSVLEYPTWEQIGHVVYEPELLTIGYTEEDNVTIDKNKEVLVLISGNEDCWLDDCEVWFATSPKSRYISNKHLAQVDETKHNLQINNMYNKYIEDWLSMNPGYIVRQDIIASRIETSFPPTAGVTFSAVYTPKSRIETIFVLYPNRNVTISKDTALYIEIKNKRTYLKQENNSIAGGYTHDANELDSLYIEERVLVSPESTILPFHVFIATPM